MRGFHLPFIEGTGKEYEKPTAHPGFDLLSVSDQGLTNYDCINEIALYTAYGGLLNATTAQFAWE